MCSKNGRGIFKKTIYTYTEVDGKIVGMICKVCSINVDHIQARYRGKVVDDVEKYGKEGTNYILKPNFVRHMNSEAHKTCVDIETGLPRSKNKKLSVKPLVGQ